MTALTRLLVRSAVKKVALVGNLLTVGCLVSGCGEELEPVAPEELGQVSQKLAPTGSHDSSSYRYATNDFLHSGWACDGDNYAYPLDVHLYVQNVGTVSCPVF